MLKFVTSETIVDIQSEYRVVHFSQHTSDLLRWSWRNWRKWWSSYWSLWYSFPDFFLANEHSLKHRWDLFWNERGNNWNLANRIIRVQKVSICSPSHCCQGDLIWDVSFLWEYIQSRDLFTWIYQLFYAFSWRSVSLFILRYEKTSTVNGSAAETILCFRKCYYGELKWFLTLRLCNNVNTSPLWDCPPHYDNFVCGFLTNSIITHPNYH